MIPPEQEARRRAHEIYRKARRRMLSIFKRGVRKKFSKDPKRPLLHFCVEVSGLMLAYAKLAGYEAHVVSVWLDDEIDGYYHDVIMFDVDGVDEWFDPTGFAGLGEVSDWRYGMELDWVDDDEALVKAERLFTPAMRKALITPAMKAHYGLSKNPPLPLVVLDHQGRHFETGVPVTFRFVRNTAPSPYMGERFQQHIEPAGRYMTHVENPHLPVDPSGRTVFETGLVTFKSPIVLLGSTDGQGYGPNSWKAHLANHYQATGLELSRAILEDGHDGIVTVASVRGEPYTSEIVDLGVISRRNPGPDERLRLLERQATQGDHRAADRLRLEQCRALGHDLWPTPFGDDRQGWRRSCVRCRKALPSGPPQRNPPMGCSIVSLSEDADWDAIEEITDRDVYEIMEEAETLFRNSGIRISSVEELHEACLSPEGRVLGASVVGLETSEPYEWDDELRPRYVFSIAVLEEARRRGIARNLIESLMDGLPSDEVLLEGKVVNPHMAVLLGKLGFRSHEEWKYEDREDGGKEWTDWDRQVGRGMFRPNPRR